MNAAAQFLSPSDAAGSLGVSTKALRLYEERGLIAPVRTEAGWRTYGPDEMKRAREIVALRGLGFSLAQIARIQNADSDGLEDVLAAHQNKLDGQMREIGARIEKVRALRDSLAGGQMPTAAEITELAVTPAEPVAAFDLPWPWGGERFEVREIRPVTYLIGPLFSGKTKLARRLAEELPNALFLGLDRLEHDRAAVQEELGADPALHRRVERTLTWLAEDGANQSDALVALVTGLEADGPDVLVVDLIEQGLDEATQHALAAYLRGRGADARPLFVMTRSSAILDLGAVGPNEAIILCPANHSPPTFVTPCPGAPGYEAVASCLASSEVRARSEGVIAWRPPAA